jgi:hypothetical protein
MTLYISKINIFHDHWSTNRINIKMSIDANDVFMRNRPDPRLVTRLATDSWFDVVSYLPVRDIVPALPLTCRYFNREVVWGRWSGRLMWGQMTPGPEGIDELVFKLDDDDLNPSQTPLMRICERGASLAHAWILIMGGANVNAVDCDNWTALFWASRLGNSNMVSLLLEVNANPNIADIDGWTPLLTACMRNHPSVVSLLIEAKPGASVNHANDEGRTALMIASMWDNVDCVRLLVNERADISIRNNEGRTALDLAWLNSDIISILIAGESYQTL